MACPVENIPCSCCSEKASKHARMVENSLNKYETYFESFQDAFEEGDAEVFMTNHESKREVYRAFSRTNVLNAIQNGWAIECYFKGNGIIQFTILYHLQVAPKTYRPMHVCCSLDSKTNKLYIITVYDPRSHDWKWSKNLDKRVCFCDKEDYSHE
ncbi:DUF4258 domain-containing protein [Robertmurraya massiliosenegalensis]|uniref:DUF4258 domain-containing protein n=1 Tax=Robertmurraya massiliosenegalensis TaxID=1287657 RepID=UPI0002D3D7A5|nr:DUF4258 domain-containing protein [Robertmurraya massiliosenegalensis]